MATRWTNRINPISWLTRRRPREAPVAPGGAQEFATPAAYVSTSQDDYTAVDRPAHDATLEWFAESASEGDFDPDLFQPNPRSLHRWPLPRTRALAYDSKNQILEITFTQGGTYRYDGVTLAQWNGISSAPSTGMWFDANLKPINQGYKV